MFSSCHSPARVKHPWEMPELLSLQRCARVPHRERPKVSPGHVTELSSSSGLSPVCADPGMDSHGTEPQCELNKAFGSLEQPVGLGGRSSIVKPPGRTRLSAPRACPKGVGGAGVRRLLGNHPKYLGWAHTGSAPSPFHGRAKCPRLRWNFTPQLGRIQGSGYRLPYSLTVLVLRQHGLPGLSAAPLCPRGLAGGAHPGHMGCEAAPTLEEQENPKNLTHYFNN